MPRHHYTSAFPSFFPPVIANEKSQTVSTPTERKKPHHRERCMTKHFTICSLLDRTMSANGKQRTILITGANKGLGFEVIKKLLKDSPEDRILLGTRDLQRGEEALKKLGSPSNVHLLQIDTSSAESIARAAKEIQSKYQGQLDVLINNAGIAPSGLTVENARQLLATNYYGVKLVNKHLGGFIRENGRIVNVASEVGAWTLHEMSKELQEKYKSPSLTTEQLDALVEEFVASIQAKKIEQSGYNVKSPVLAYGVSKAALIAQTKIEARQWSGAKNVLVLSVCPGYCSTDINHHGPGSRPAELGAISILHPINAPANQLENGEFYQDGEHKAQSLACTMDLSTIQASLGEDK